MLDGLDGHIARYLDACTPVGAELDSLCDLADFGVCPALIMYFYTTQKLPYQEGDWATDNFVWMACIAHAAACCARLARFNLTDREKPMEDPNAKPARDRAGSLVPTYAFEQFYKRPMYFEGVPAPVGAAYTLMPMMFAFITEGSPFFVVLNGFGYSRRMVVVQLVLTALLMVSSLPTLSSKMLKRDKKDTHLKSTNQFTQSLKVGSGVAFLALMCSIPIELFLFGTICHVLSLPVGCGLFMTIAK